MPEGESPCYKMARWQRAKSHFHFEIKQRLYEFSSICIEVCCLLRIDVGRVNSLKGGDGDVGNVSVQLVDAVLVFVTLAGESDADSDRDTLDTLGPKVFVEAGVDTDVLRTHLLLSEITDRLDSSGRTSLGSDTEDAFMHMDGILASDDLVDRALSGFLLGLLRCRRHLKIFKCFSVLNY